MLRRAATLGQAASCQTANMHAEAFKIAQTGGHIWAGGGRPTSMPGGGLKQCPGKRESIQQPTMKQKVDGQ